MDEHKLGGKSRGNDTPDWLVELEAGIAGLSETLSQNDASLTEISALPGVSDFKHREDMLAYLLRYERRIR